MEIIMTVKLENYSDMLKSRSNRNVLNNHSIDYVEFVPRYESFYAIKSNCKLSLDICNSFAYMEDECFSNYMKWILECDSK